MTFQQGVGRLPRSSAPHGEQHSAPLPKGGVEDLATHGRDLTDQIPPAAHTGHEWLPDDACLDLAAVALTGLCHGTAALALNGVGLRRARCRW